ncbi:MAG TPA: phosphoribosylamine--glycine ligase [candidate division Zixibacteria bacterium]|nr:phosphoribosylamine--glycine ligase [candidate division Zixibacteria bacterium]
MKVLVVGGGGREHAIVWKLSQSRFVEKIYCAPGNAGIAKLAESVAIADTDIRNLASFVEKVGVDFTIVGPESALSEGIVDYFNARKLNIFGPTKAAAQIESSKIFAKEFMKEFHIPTASWLSFDKPEDAIKFLESHELPLVIKADGLAAGKGTVVAENMEEAKDAVRKMMIERAWGEAGRRILIEEFMPGREVSVLAFTDGKTVVPMVSSTDYKRAFDGGEGPNTGGMGTIAPNPNITGEMLDRVRDEVILPVVEGLGRKGHPFKGVLYTGLMIRDGNFKVLEFNCRFGDPETQVVLPLLESDLMEIILHIHHEKLDEAEILWKHELSAACIIMASGGYPKRYKKGLPIEGLDKISDPNTQVFHAGTTKVGDKIVTNGGRVLGVTAWDNSLEKALNRAYKAVDKISWEKGFHRRDIGEGFLKR